MLRIKKKLPVDSPFHSYNSFLSAIKRLFWLLIMYTMPRFTYILSMVKYNFCPPTTAEKCNLIKVALFCPPNQFLN